MGRPPLPIKLTRKAISLPSEVWDEIAEFRFTERIPSEAEALRRLIEIALKARAGAKQRRRPGV
jgi:hypothetical protein